MVAPFLQTEEKKKKINTAVLATLSLFAPSYSSLLSARRSAPHILAMADVSDSAIAQAYADVRDDKTETNWCARRVLAGVCMCPLT